MRRFFNILLGALAMIAVALLSAFVTMRLAIHGREVEVPSLAGLTIAEARGTAANLGLNVNVENQFYSTVTPAGRVLSQYPAPGTKVRREWVMRIAESIGPQKVSVPNVIGKTEREATATIRQLSLDLGTVAYIPAPGPTGVVLSQTPTPAAAGVDGPRISLLVSEPVPAVTLRPAVLEAAQHPANAEQDPSGTPSAPQATTAPPAETPAQASAPAQPGTPFQITSTNSSAPDSAVKEEAYVMPNLIGLSLTAASGRVAAMGLHIYSVESAAPVVRQIAPVGAPAPPGSPSQPSALISIAPIQPITLSNTVIAQRPAAGRRVTRADPIRITLAR